mmetsp:Transcript_22607/g.51795  ORF Transcript_22607/g.51795 Transcript_22607/m.51795 type:complete len:241 (-) Transcript_22607:648-1370(-)
MSAGGGRPRTPGYVPCGHPRSRLPVGTLEAACCRRPGYSHPPGSTTPRRTPKISFSHTPLCRSDLSLSRDVHCPCTHPPPSPQDRCPPSGPVPEDPRIPTHPGPRQSPAPTSGGADAQISRQAVLGAPGDPGHGKIHGMDEVRGPGSPGGAGATGTTMSALDPVSAVVYNGLLHPPRPREQWRRVRGRGGEGGTEDCRAVGHSWISPQHFAGGFGVGRGSCQKSVLLCALLDREHYLPRT